MADDNKARIMETEGLEIIKMIAVGVPVSLTVITQLDHLGPRWIWSGCMDPGPGLSGCASVVPIGLFAVLIPVSAAMIILFRPRVKTDA